MVAGVKCIISLLIPAVLSGPVLKTPEPQTGNAALGSASTVVQAAEGDTQSSSRRHALQGSCGRSEECTSIKWKHASRDCDSRPVDTHSTEYLKKRTDGKLEATRSWTRLSIALEPEDPALLERTLLDISTPSSKRYGRHLTADEAKALLKPRKEGVEAIREWIQDLGIDKDEGSVQYDGQWVHVDMPNDEARHLLLHDSQTHEERQTGFDLPPHLQRHITLVHRSAALPEARNDQRVDDLRDTETRRGEHEVGHEPRAAVDFNSCKQAMTPDCLKALYNTNGIDSSPSKKSLFGVVGFDQQAAQNIDLNLFVKAFAPYATSATFNVALVNGGTNIQSNSSLSAEANFDTQYAVVLPYKVPVKFISVGGENHNFKPDLDLPDTNQYIEPYLQFAMYLLNLPDSQLPQTVSISYGVNEQLVPPSYAKQVCDIFGQLGTRGVSVIAASGDTGPGVSCVSNGNAGSKNGTQRFLPAFPATCPYVTTVGGTMIASVKGDKVVEQGLSYSSGGFSDYFPRPSWQGPDVQRYVDSQGTKFQGYYNKTGRGYPDVAAHGAAIQFYNHGKLDSFDGTSASAPIFASVIALLNDQRLKIGKRPLGFLNPWIYTYAKLGFNDVLTGRSEGCDGTTIMGDPAPAIAGAGWDTARGWDAVTGYGTPDFQKLKFLL